MSETALSTQAATLAQSSAPAPAASPKANEQPQPPAQGKPSNSSSSDQVTSKQGVPQSSQTQPPAPESSPAPKEETPAPKDQGAEEPAYTITLFGEDIDFKNEEELATFTEEKMNAALDLAERYEKGMKAFAEKPFLMALEATIAAHGGDRKAGYAAFMDQVAALAQAYDEEKKLPPAERRAREVEAELELEKQNTKRLLEENAARERQSKRAQEEGRLLTEFKGAIQEAGLPPTQAVGEALVNYVQARRDLRTGKRPSFQEAARYLKENPQLYLSKEEYRKMLRAEVEAEAKAPPQNGKTDPKAEIEAIRQARDAAGPTVTEQRGDGKPVFVRNADWFKLRMSPTQ